MKTLTFLLLCLMLINSTASAKTNINAPKQSVANAFYQAAARADKESIQRLIQQGYLIESQDGRGNTALCLALLNKNQKAYDLLVKNGADTDANCTRFINAQQLAASKSSMIYLNNGLSDTVYSEDYNSHNDDSSFYWKSSYTVGLGLAALLGGGVALAAGGGGSGGGSSNLVNNSEEKNILLAEVPSCLGGTWVTDNGVKTCHCPDSKILLNGACVEKVDDKNGDGKIDAADYDTKSVSNSGVISLTDSTPGLTAQLGARAVNTGTIIGTSSSLNSDLTGIYVEGFSAASHTGTLAPETLLNTGAASQATNGGNIELTQGSPVSGSLYGMAAYAGAVAQNDRNGSITLNATQMQPVYGMYAEQVGTGFENYGKINLNLSAKAQNAYGIFAQSRGVINHGTITTTVTNPTFSSATYGTAAALLGYDLKNNGNILLRRGEAVGAAVTENTFNVYGMYIKNKEDTVNTPESDETTTATENNLKGGLGINNGLISFDVTKSPYYIYGMFADNGTTGLTNNGRIEFFGDLSSKNLPNSAGIGGVYAMRWIGGYGSIVNEGEIETRHYNETTKEYENLSISGNTYLALLQGFAGSITNKKPLNIFIENNSTADDSWSINAIYLDRNGNGTGITNESKIEIQVIDGQDVDGNTLKAGSQIAGIVSTSADVVNKGDITIISDTDNLNLYGLDLAIGSGTNSEYTKIKINGGGANTHLGGMVATGATGSNYGDITITHTSSGMISGSGGVNAATGTVNLYANPKTDGPTEMNIVGMSGDTNEGKIKIEATKGTIGQIYGIGNVYSQLTNSGSVSITLKDRTQKEYGSIIGLALDPGVSERGTLTNSGLLEIDASAYANGKDALLGTVVGAFANGGDIINEENALIDISVNGTSGIIGMQNQSKLMIGEEIPQLYKIENNGTLNIKAMDTVAGYTELGNLQDDSTTIVPFNVMGIVTNSYAVNNGEIFLDVSGDANVAGMVAYDGGMAVNYGLIEFKGNAENFTALYGTGTRVFNQKTEEPREDETDGETVKTTVVTQTQTVQYSSVYNYGRIKVNETMFSDSQADDYINGSDGALEAKVGKDKETANQIAQETTLTYDENGTLINTEVSNPNYTDYVAGTELTGGLVIVPPAEGETTTTQIATKQVVLNNGVNYYSEIKASFEAPGKQVVGSVISGTTNVMNGNKLSYVANGQGEGAIIGNGDASMLGISSASYLFNASFENNQNNANGLDIVMTMKSFDEVTDNSSLAAFLSANYASGNNEAFFNDIKSIGSAVEFTSAMNDLTGSDTITRFTNEDLTVMREVNQTMNNLMFANNDKPMFETNGTVNAFGFKNDNNTTAQYALANKRITPRVKIGYAMSNTTMNTDDDNDNSRRNSVFQAFAPISYDRYGWQMIATPQVGFARGHYNRKGFNGSTYEGVIEKRILALMNEARYPMTFGKFEIAPTVQFNAIAYNQKGSEEAKAYSLTMPSDNNLSVEAGLGLNARHKLGNLNLTAGLMLYREFADPYNIKMGMNGMDGTFNLYDDVSEYRGTALFGFDYGIGDLDLYGSLQHFVEQDSHTNFKAGLKWTF